MREKRVCFVYFFRDCVSVRGCERCCVLYECYIKSFAFVCQREEKCDQWRIKWCTISFVCLHSYSLSLAHVCVMLFVLFTFLPLLALLDQQ